MTYALRVLNQALTEETRLLRSNEAHAKKVKANIGRRHTPQECHCQRLIRTERRRIAELRAAIERLER